MPGRVARVSIGIPVLAAELGHNSAEGAPGSGFWNLGLGLIFLSRSSIHRERCVKHRFV